MATKGQELATIPAEGLYLVQYKDIMDFLRESIAENIGAGGITPFQLPRIRVPAGGATVWEVPNIEGESTAEKELRLVVAHWKVMRAYYKVSFDTSGGGSPPDCTSDDGIVGIGDPGVACKACKFNQFGTGANGTGKACREIRGLFVIGTDDMLPYFMPMPPTSIKPVQQFFLQLTQRGLPFWSVETAFSLEKATSKGNIAYARAILKLGRRLNDSERERMAKYREALRPAIDGMQLTREDAYAFGQDDDE